MKNKVILTIIVASIFIIGCATNDSSSQEINYDPIQYETSDERGQIQKSPEVDYKYYKQSQRRMKEFKETDTPFHDTDLYTDEETDRVVEHLESQDNIIKAQAASENNRIIVAVILSEHGSRDVGNEIEKEVRAIVQDKEIIVYTDYTYWEEAKDELASGGASSLGEGVEDFLKRFFDLDINE